MHDNLYPCKCSLLPTCRLSVPFFSQLYNLTILFRPALTGNDAMAKRRLEAQRRAVSAMTKQAASFATAAMDDDDGEEGMDGQPLDSTATPSLEDGAPECIVCREKSGEAMGYLAFLQTSSVIKGVIQRHSDCKEMQSVYRVVANGGCTITQHASKTSKSLAHVPHGGHVLVGSRAGRWMRIVSPTPGWVPIYQSTSPTAQKLGSDPSESDGYQRLLYEKPGAPVPTLKVNLHPVSDLQFNHFGGDRVHGRYNSYTFIRATLSYVIKADKTLCLLILCSFIMRARDALKVPHEGCRYNVRSRH